MGMAASQARYLALTARKTNTEYEGQQINQARTALANQSANLFNRLLDLEVPVAPKTTDYTEVQYSYSDGENESVISDWQQLSTADPNYNYIVNHYYMTNVYTGSQKLLSDPQVQSRRGVEQKSIKELMEAQGYSNPTINISYSADGAARVMVNGVELEEPVYLPISGMTKDTNLENALDDLAMAKYKAEADGVLNEDLVYGYQDGNGTWHFIMQDDITPTEYYTEYKPSYIGNCELTELETLTEDQKAELKQIMRDLPDSEFAKYCRNYFDKEGNYIVNGQNGIYSFTMNGKNYYACESDLFSSMQTYDEYGKPIDSQQKLPYYSASYIPTRIEETNKALLETDGNGRFKSVKFDDDSIVYTLNTETVTDEAAYQDAMNEYNYKVEQYEKTIADINARTSIIHQQDRTLELRLKQLDTEHNALSVELEAVKKVIKDNVDKTFKTFSD